MKNYSNEHVRLRTGTNPTERLMRTVPVLPELMEFCIYWSKYFDALFLE